jgi:hypothetical protein
MPFCCVDPVRLDLEQARKTSHYLHLHSPRLRPLVKQFEAIFGFTEWDIAELTLVVREPVPAFHCLLFAEVTVQTPLPLTVDQLVLGIPHQHGQAVVVTCHSC